MSGYAIPMEMRGEMSADPKYSECMRKKEFDDHVCEGRIEWEHALCYAGRRLNEKWAIVPICWYVHRGPGLDKEKNVYLALASATDEDLAKYPKSDFAQRKKYLVGKYGELSTGIVPF